MLLELGLPVLQQSGSRNGFPSEPDFTVKTGLSTFYPSAWFRIEVTVINSFESRFVSFGLLYCAYTSIIRWYLE